MGEEVSTLVQCPACHAPVMVEPHCESPSCPWTRCLKCRAVFGTVCGRLKIWGKS
jgi:hypothetical protein